MWQLRKLSTNEALSDPGPLPNNWGPIFGLHGFLEKIGDLSWAGDFYADQGWIQLTCDEQEAIRRAEVLSRIEAEKNIANKALSNPDITVGSKIVWNDYLLALDKACLCLNIDCDAAIPARPNA